MIDLMFAIFLHAHAHLICNMHDSSFFMYPGGQTPVFLVHFRKHSTHAPFSVHFIRPLTPYQTVSTFSNTSINDQAICMVLVVYGVLILQ